MTKEEQKIYQKKPYQNRSEKGLCVVCGLPAVSKSYCQRHLEINRERMRQYRKKHPTKSKESNRKYKESHREEIAAYRKKWYQEHKAEQLARVWARIKKNRAEGLCIVCGKPRVTKNHCEYHRAVDIKKSRKYRTKKKTEIQP